MRSITGNILDPLWGRLFYSVYVPPLQKCEGEKYKQIFGNCYKLCELVTLGYREVSLKGKSLESASETIEIIVAIR